MLMTKTICKCGAKIPSYKTMCDKCAEEIKFKKANKINLENYKYDCLYDHNIDEYFSDIDELNDFYDENKDLKYPRYVYGCKPIRFKLDMYSIVENELICNHSEGAFDYITSSELNKIQEIVDEWTEKQDITSWEIDNRTIILLN